MKAAAKTAQEQSQSALIADAIATLTAAARQDGADFGEIACHVITAVAANLGDVEDLLAWRPGSWEADHVRNIVLSTVGDDHRELLRYRTEPIRLELDIEGVWCDFGLEQLYNEAVDELGEADDAAHLALSAAVATPEERARLDEIDANHKSKFLDPDFDMTLLDEAYAIASAIERRAQEARHPLLAAREAAGAALVTLDELLSRDQSAYREAYTQTARQALADRGLSIGIEVVDPRPLSLDAAYQWDPITDWLEGRAREVTPLPMGGQLPDWSDGKPADALRRAGLTYLERVRLLHRVA